MQSVLQNLKRRWGPILCSWVPLEHWHRLYNVDLLLPRYHVVGDREPEHISGLTLFRRVDTFKADMMFFLKSYTPVGLDDIADHLDGEHRLPRRCFLPTFDDGFREVFDVAAPLLASLGIPAVFFLNTSVLDNRDLLDEQKKCLLIRALVSLPDSPALREVSRTLADAGVKGPNLPIRIRGIAYSQRRLLDTLGLLLECDFRAYAASVQPYVTSAQVRQLTSKGFAIGAHSVDHPHYSEISLEEQLAQTRESVGHLRDYLRCDCLSFAFPYLDTGVSPSFFNNIFADGRLKVSFGSDGIRRHFCRRNLERFKMDYIGLTASQILAREFYIATFRKPAWAIGE
jgi:peptidoglycan/xylan/chitin deacetylase (PgdA/CDA1 family)